MSTATLQVRVAHKRAEAQDICSLELVAANGGALPAFTAGAHIDVHLPNGLQRQYSLCNAPGETQRYVIGVLRDAASRGGSANVHDALAEGSVLTISTPRNLFPLAEQAPHHLLLAGGIGITPMLAMAEHLANTGQSFALHHCNRSRARTAFVERLATSPYSDKVQHHFDDGDTAQKLDIAGTLQHAPPGTHLYVCGPQGFMDAVLNAGRTAGWPEERLHREYFGAAPVDHTNDGSFELEIASTGKVIKVLPDQTALEALHAAGVDIPMSCEQGVCGTCLTRVKAGTPDHRDQYLMPEEQAANDQFLPCCSRASSTRLVLDL
ncbi:PDR/VanB family oxidoreductase [Rhodoferax saidenbachensis]|uniref:Vanillate O-demethylase ferredoxin subunit n=1 Tax=Rhodoferax saidenbachensis TaxID=1484693 RepID=A0ABU1ZKM7_9BURK|nr:PDR/VanB family oxidoreductase [Rhodoferax saidenbachensis]MDR7305501.1 vanillate O-demethylase ferredoxin subunit [Rhodoferax saidenbachensis]